MDVEKEFIRIDECIGKINRNHYREVAKRGKLEREIKEVLFDDFENKIVDLYKRIWQIEERLKIIENLKTSPNKDFTASPKVCPYCCKDFPNYVFSNKFCKKCDKLMRIAPDGGYHCENCYGKL